MRAVVTGGAGFIGSHLVDALVARGDEVTVIDDLSTGRRELVPPQARLVEHDVRVPFEVAADVVFHLAAQADLGTSMLRPSFDAEVNVVGTVNALEGARVWRAPRPRLDRRRDLRRRDRACDRARRAAPRVGIWRRQGRGRVVHTNGHVCLRFANVYGPRQSSSLEGGVVAIFLERLGRGDETLIFGDGAQTRDFVHVDDVVAALLAAADHRGGVYNVGSGVETSVSALYALCAAIVGSKQPPTYAEARPGDARRSVLDCSRAHGELGWRAGLDLEAGLRETWESVRKE